MDEWMHRCMLGWMQDSGGISSHGDLSLQAAAAHWVSFASPWMLSSPGSMV